MRPTTNHPKQEYDVSKFFQLLRPSSLTRMLTTEPPSFPFDGIALLADPIHGYISFTVPYNSHPDRRTDRKRSDRLSLGATPSLHSSAPKRTLGVSRCGTYSFPAFVRNDAFGGTLYDTTLSLACVKLSPIFPLCHLWKNLPESRHCFTISGMDPSAIFLTITFSINII